MKSRKRWYWIIGLLVVVLAGLVVGGLSLLGGLPWQRGNVYEDPQGRFTIETDPGWEEIETDGRYTQFKVPEPPLNIYLLVLDAGTVDDAFSQAMEVVGFDTGLLGGDSVTTYGDWYAYQQQDAAGITYALAGQVVGEKAFVMLLKTDSPGVSPENMAILRALYSIKIAGQEEMLIEGYPDVEAMVQKEVDRLSGGMSIAVVHQGEIVYTYSYGLANPVAAIPVDDQTIYQYGSMTKVVTASALMQLEEQGLVDLDARAGDYIPEFPESWKITVRQLLTHSACLEENSILSNGLIAFPEESFDPLKDVFTNYIQDFPDLLCAPGKASAYSNPPFLVLARIIEEVSGEPYTNYVIDHILTPLEMESTQFKFVEAGERYAKDQFPASKVDNLLAEVTSFRGPGQEKLVLLKSEQYATLDDYQILPPWGGLRGTASDVTHFMQMHLSGGRYGDTQVLKPETVAAMQVDQPSTDGVPLGFGLSWWLGSDDLGDYFFHVGDGAGSESTMRIYPELDLGVALMSNVRGYQRDRIVEGLVKAAMKQK